MATNKKAQRGSKKQAPARGRKASQPSASRQPAARNRRNATMAATARTSERVAGEDIQITQAALQAGAQAALEGGQRLTEQARQAFGLNAGAGEALARQSSESFEAVTRTGTALAQGVQDLSREWLVFLQEGMQRNMTRFGEFARCRSLPEFLALQGEFLRETLEHNVEAGRKLAALSTRLVNDAGQAVSTVQPTTRRAA
jgi:phasin family protein